MDGSASFASEPESDTPVTAIAPIPILTAAARLPKIRQESQRATTCSTGETGSMQLSYPDETTRAVWQEEKIRASN